MAERRDDDASEEDAKRDKPGNAVVGEGGQSRDTQERQGTHPHRGSNPKNQGRSPRPS